MTLNEEYRSIQEEYARAVEETLHKKRGLGGLFGIGMRLSDEPCHKELDGKIEALCRRAAEEGEPAELRELTERILHAQSEWDGAQVADLMLAAIQRHALPLIPRLRAEERAALGAWYEKQYPRRTRLPVQDQILKALKG